MKTMLLPHPISTRAVFLLCLALIRPGTGSCPSCHCDNAKLAADCSGSQLDGLPIFLNPATKTLLASNNKISQFEGLLGIYHELERLDLSNNEFHSLGELQFESQNKLQQLNLSNNFISALHTQTFVGPQALQTLDLSRNILDSLPDHVFSSLVSLVELDLSHNKISAISKDAFSGLNRLRVLSLEHNLVEVVDPTWMFSLENLRFFYLSNNFVTTLTDDAFRPLSALKVLSLFQNRIFQVHPFTFRGLRSLDTLDLSFNQLVQVPNRSLVQLQQLLRLNLSGNPITHIGRQCLQSMFTLEELDLNHMQKLESIGGHSLLDNTNLRILSLENNPKLHPLPWGLYATNGLLHQVSYRNNTWSTLAIQQVPQQSLRKLLIEGLPLHCNCSLIWLWELYQKQNETQIQLDVARCATRPPSSSSDVGDGRPELDQLSPDELSCDDWTHILVIISASVLAVIFILFAASICLYKIRSYRLRSKYAGSPCFHIKDDTMIYPGTLESPMGPYKNFTSLEPHLQQQQPPNRLYSPIEPFYEVPKFGDELEPRSSSTSSGDSVTKYTTTSSSAGGGVGGSAAGIGSLGYVGSELWENDYMSTTADASPAHSYANPLAVMTPSGMFTNVRNLAARNCSGSPQSSSGIGTGSDTSSMSLRSRQQLFFSPVHTHTMAHGNGLNGSGGLTGFHGGSHHTLMWMHPKYKLGSGSNLVPANFGSSYRKGSSRKPEDVFMSNQRDGVELHNVHDENNGDHHRGLNLLSSPKNKESRFAQSPKERKSNRPYQGGTLFV